MHGQVEFGKRLSAAAELVRPGAVFADIGTDHASLPIYLASLGRIKHAYACDVAEKPVAVAERNIAESGFSHLIDVRLTDGFCGLEGLGITDAALCGMGAELMAQLISAESAEFIKRDRVRLILQPMSRTAFLRSFLAENGFSAVEELIVRDMGRQYEIICAEYTGEPYELNPVEALLGRKNVARGGEELAVLYRRRRLHLQNVLGGQTEEEQKTTEGLISELEKIENEVLK